MEYQYKNMTQLQKFVNLDLRIENLKCLDEVFRFLDGDGTVCNLLKIVKFCYPLSEITYISDIDMHNMPETKIKGINFEVLSKE